MNIEIKPLTKDLKEDYLFLFDNMVHKENPEWSKCYCNDYHFLGDVETCTHAMSRAMIIDRIEENELQGYLVFNEGKAVGWCNVNNRSNYQRLIRDYELIESPGDKICSLVCFLIHPDFRRKGISQQILSRVISDYSDTEYDYLEAYPKKDKTGTSNFNGSLELYKRNGFKVVKEYEKYSLLRRKLN